MHGECVYVYSFKAISKKNNQWSIKEFRINKYIIVKCKEKLIDLF